MNSWLFFLLFSQFDDEELDLEKESIVKIPIKVGRKKKTEAEKKSKSQAANIGNQKPLVSLVLLWSF